MAGMVADVEKNANSSSSDSENDISNNSNKSILNCKLNFFV
jgi:hypothetical protein